MVVSETLSDLVADLEAELPDLWQLLAEAEPDLLLDLDFEKECWRSKTAGQIDTVRVSQICS